MIIMVNPAFGGQTVSTSNLLAAFTVLEPGDRAVPERLDLVREETQ